MEARSNVEVIGVFVVMPVVFGLAVMIFCVWNAITHGAEFSASDWFWQVGWFGLLGMGLTICLPYVGVTEIRKRRRMANGKADQA